MALITKYGSIWGMLPNTAGRVFWVAPTSPYLVEGRSYDASDQNDGLSPERALATINRAATVLATANAGDVVVMLPGTHVLTAAITASTAGITFMGLPSGAGNKMRQKTVVQATASAACFAITAADIEVAYLHMVPTTANSAVTISAAGSRSYLHHCSVDMNTAAVSTSTRGFQATGAASNVLVEQCIFLNAGAQGPAVVATALLDSIVQDCDFITQSGVWAAAMLCGAATARLNIRRCYFTSVGTTATMTRGIDGSGSTILPAVTVEDCRFAGGVGTQAGGIIVNAISRFGNSGCYSIENYQGFMDITTSTGSTLQIVTT